MMILLKQKNYLKVSLIFINEKKEIAFIGGGIDSEIGRIHYNAINLTNKFTVSAGCSLKKR